MSFNDSQTHGTFHFLKAFDSPTIHYILRASLCHILQLTSVYVMCWSHQESWWWKEGGTWNRNWVLGTFVPSWVGLVYYTTLLLGSPCTTTYYIYIMSTPPTIFFNQSWPSNNRGLVSDSGCALHFGISCCCCHTTETLWNSCVNRKSNISLLMPCPALLVISRIEWEMNIHWGGLSQLMLKEG